MLNLYVRCIFFLFYMHSLLLSVSTKRARLRFLSSAFFERDHTEC